MVEHGKWGQGLWGGRGSGGWEVGSLSWEAPLGPGAIRQNGNWGSPVPLCGGPHGGSNAPSHDPRAQPPRASESLSGSWGPPAVGHRAQNSQLPGGQLTPPTDLGDDELVARPAPAVAVVALFLSRSHFWSLIWASYLYCLLWLLLLSPWVCAKGWGLSPPHPVGPCSILGQHVLTHPPLSPSADKGSGGPGGRGQGHTAAGRRRLSVPGLEIVVVVCVRPPLAASLANTGYDA